jgi:hypothetical protein
LTWPIGTKYPLLATILKAAQIVRIRSIKGVQLQINQSIPIEIFLNPKKNSKNSQEDNQNKEKGSFYNKDNKNHIQIGDPQTISIKPIKQIRYKSKSQTKSQPK